MIETVNLARKNLDLAEKKGSGVHTADEKSAGGALGRGEGIRNNNSGVTVRTLGVELEKISLSQAKMMGVSYECEKFEFKNLN